MFPDHVYNERYALRIRSFLCAGILLFVSSALTIARAQEFNAEPDPLSPQLERMLELAATEGTVDVVTATVKMAIEAAPEREAEILTIVATTNPELAEPVAEALGLRDRVVDVAKAAVAEQDAEAAATAIREAQIPRFFSFEGWKGRVALGISSTTGNSEQTEGSLDARVERRQGTWFYELYGLVDLANADGTATRERYEAQFQLNKDFTERFFAFGRLLGVVDRFTGFDYRSSLTSGIGYHAIKRERVDWRVQAGPTVRLEEPEDAVAQTSVGGSLGSRFRWLIQEDGAVFLNNSEAIATETTTLTNLASFQVPLYKSISLGLSNEVRYEFNPPVDAENLDTTTRVSIGYTF